MKSLADVRSYIPATMTHPAYIALPDEMACARCGRVVNSQGIDELRDGGIEFVCAPCYRMAVTGFDCYQCMFAVMESVAS